MTKAVTRGAPQAQLDHLVVAAASLEEGVRWAEATLGITPGPGGKHPLMGTHNRLFNLSSPGFPRAFFEIIAIDPEAVPLRAPGLKRWFGMDDPALQQQLARGGPQLVHWVARAAPLDAALQGLEQLDLDAGTALQASRMTPAGLLQWRMAVRDDGQPLFDGCLPTLMEWSTGSAADGVQHPAEGMPPSGITLESLRLQHPRAQALAAACSAIGLGGFANASGPPRLSAVLQTPRGAVTLCSGLASSEV